MKDSSTRQAWRIGLVAALLPMALGSAAQGGLKWQGTATPSPAIAQAAPSGIPAATPPLDVRNFEAIAQQLVAGGRIPGLAVAIVQNGRVLSARGYGVTDARNGEPVDAHTVFRLASLSKSFAGTVTGMLVNDGVLRWDSRLTDYVPSFRLSSPDAAQQVTVADLLSHRTGLTHNAYDRDLEGNLPSARIPCRIGTNTTNIPHYLSIFLIIGNIFSCRVNFSKPFYTSRKARGYLGIGNGA